MKDYIIIYSDDTTETVSGESLYFIMFDIVEKMDIYKSQERMRELCLQGVDNNRKDLGEAQGVQDLVYIYNQLNYWGKDINEIFEIGNCPYGRTKDVEEW